MWPGGGLHLQYMAQVVLDVIIKVCWRAVLKVKVSSAYLIWYIPGHLVSILGVSDLYLVIG